MEVDLESHKRAWCGDSYKLQLVVWVPLPAWYSWDNALCCIITACRLVGCGREWRARILTLL